MSRAQHYAASLFPDSYQSDYRDGVMIALETPLPPDEREKLSSFVGDRLSELCKQYADNEEVLDVYVMAAHAVNAVTDYWMEET